MEKKVEGSKEVSLSKLNLELQGKNIELLKSMYSLTSRIDKLITIFEEAANNVGNIEEDKRIKELTDKLETLLDQNKNLANGLLLLEKYVRNKSSESSFRKLWALNLF